MKQGQAYYARDPVARLGDGRGSGCGQKQESVATPVLHAESPWQSLLREDAGHSSAAEQEDKQSGAAVQAQHPLDGPTLPTDDDNPGHGRRDGEAGE